MLKLGTLSYVFLCHTCRLLTIERKNLKVLTYFKMLLPKSKKYHFHSHFISQISHMITLSFKVPGSDTLSCVKIDKKYDYYIGQFVLLTFYILKLRENYNSVLCLSIKIKHEDCLMNFKLPQINIMI